MNNARSHNDSFSWEKCSRALKLHRFSRTTLNVSQYKYCLLCGHSHLGSLSSLSSISSHGSLSSLGYAYKLYELFVCGKLSKLICNLQILSICAHFTVWHFPLCYVYCTVRHGDKSTMCTGAKSCKYCWCLPIIFFILIWDANWNLWCLGFMTGTFLLQIHSICKQNVFKPKSKDVHIFQRYTYL